MSRITVTNTILPKYINVKYKGCFTYLSIDEATIPYQGWKIHVSATLHNYQSILETTVNCCLSEETSLKFINDTDTLLDIFSKKASPIEVGKFITIYPKNDQKFIKLIEKLHNKLRNYQGIQILTDQQYQNSNNIFYRYGIMNASLTNEERPPLIDQSGNKFPDIQGPYYECPNFIKDPLSTDVFNKNKKELVMNNRYVMRSILHQTGSGNVYTAFDKKSQKKVVIKEARKNVQINNKITAIDLLKNEQNMLSSIHNSFIPKFIDEFYDDENYYLVEEYIKGTEISKLKNKFNLLLTRTTKERFLFNKEISKIIDHMFKNLSSIHKEGIILEDISINNMILGDDNNLYFIDLETAYKKSDGQLITTSNNYSPIRITSKNEKRDRIKLWYAIIDLLTNASSMLLFDKSGFSTIKIFLKMCFEMKFPPSLIKLFISDFEEEKQFDLSILVPYKHSIDFEILNLKKDQILATLTSSIPLKIEGNSILEKVDNYLAIKDLGLPFLEEKFEEYFSHSKNSIEIILAKIELRILLYKDYLVYFDDLLSSNKLNYKYKQRILKILNDNDDKTCLFRKLVISIKNSDIDFENNIPYVKTGQFLTPYLNNGNSGLIIELIRFSRREKTSEYDLFIKELGNGVQHTYAKSTSLKSGLTGLGLANLWMYTYFNDDSYVITCDKIFKHVCDYSIYKANHLYIVNPLQNKIDYSYSEGMLGHYYFFDQFLSLTYKNRKEHYEKIPSTI
ncbi:protein kinase domain-containing protein [Streptococcus pluranimalium]|uniref:class III lanthionine synthetase LanKC N-terminal domain-containing protein n=1 Tax=Streptococcus pluranimalium TaxID=82348 RepID=UPI00313A2FA5